MQSRSHCFAACVLPSSRLRCRLLLRRLPRRVFPHTPCLSADAVCLCVERCEMENAGRAPVPLFSSDNTPTTSASVTAAADKHPSTAPATHSAVDYTPLPWTGYFDNQHDVTVPDTQDTFRLYTAGQHDDPPYVFLLLHGGGQSSLSWACATTHLKQHTNVVALDLRGHGATHTANDTDLSTPTAIADITAALTAHYAPHPAPPMVVAGHSMGGALAIRLTAANTLPVIGCLCLDLVEGSAIASMDHIRQSVERRPAHFPSLATAVEWTVRSSLISNTTSARLSVPPTLAYHRPTQSYTWRTDLLASQPHWLGWFDGLTAAFLGCAQPKLLMLADVERLDVAMSVAQMQGRLQVVVLRGCGHQLMEDRPVEVARCMVEFCTRQQMARRGRMVKEGKTVGVLGVGS